MKNIFKIYRWGIMIVILMTVVSCSKVVLVIDDLPSNTPAGNPIFVAGNFNLWDPGDANYALALQSDSTYSIVLPRVYGKISYKFTRGDWSTCEADRCGNDIENRWFQVGSSDTLLHVIESWKDLDPVNCDSITIVVNQIPGNTPENDPIKIAGSFNAWSPGANPEYFLRKDSLKNQYLVTVPRKSYEGNQNNILTYKFVREDITVSEVDKFGREMDPRVLNFEKGDSVFVQIENWNDLVPAQLSQITIVLEDIPAHTPKKDRIYLAGNFNNWNPGDASYQFTKNSEGSFQISIPRRKYGLAFKITRGSWDTEFADACGNSFPNQEYNYDEIDTLFYKIEGWKDIKSHVNPFVTFIIEELPENTPEDAVLVLKMHQLNDFFSARDVEFYRNDQGQFQTEISWIKLNYGFLIARGPYITQEVDEQGYFIAPRMLETKCQDTMYIHIKNWNDLMGQDKMVSIVITQVPEDTPSRDDIYIAGQFNGWDPGDKEFRLKKNANGYFTVDVPLRWLKSGFKFTRGNWRKVEGNHLKGYIENRVYTGNQPRLELEIKGWED